MSKTIIIILVVFGIFFVWNKSTNTQEKKNFIPQTRKVINHSLVSNCNTPSSRTAKNCDRMYAIYKEKYTLLKSYNSSMHGEGNKIDVCTTNGIKSAKELAYNQAEEKCDYKIIDFIVDNTIGLACNHIYKNPRNFMFKSEYCKHIEH